MTQPLTSKTERHACSQNAHEQQLLTRRLQKLSVLETQNRNHNRQEAHNWRSFLKNNAKNTGNSNMCLQQSLLVRNSSQACGIAGSCNSQRAERDLTRMMQKPRVHSLNMASGSMVYSELAQTGKLAKNDLVSARLASEKFRSVSNIGQSDRAHRDHLRSNFDRWNWNVDLRSSEERHSPQKLVTSGGELSQPKLGENTLVLQLFTAGLRLLNPTPTDRGNEISRHNAVTHRSSSTDSPEHTPLTRCDVDSSTDLPEHTPLTTCGVYTGCGVKYSGDNSAALLIQKPDKSDCTRTKRNVTADKSDCTRTKRNVTADKSDCTRTKRNVTADIKSRPEISPRADKTVEGTIEKETAVINNVQPCVSQTESRETPSGISTHTRAKTKRYLRIALKGTPHPGRISKRNRGLTTAKTDSPKFIKHSSEEDSITECVLGSEMNTPDSKLKMAEKCVSRHIGKCTSSLPECQTDPESITELKLINQSNPLIDCGMYRYSHGIGNNLEIDELNSRKNNGKIFAGNTNKVHDFVLVDGKQRRAENKEDLCFNLMTIERKAQFRKYTETGNDPRSVKLPVSDLAGNNSRERNAGVLTPESRSRCLRNAQVGICAGGNRTIDTSCRQNNRSRAPENENDPFQRIGGLPLERRNETRREESVTAAQTSLESASKETRTGAGTLWQQHLSGIGRVIGHGIGQGIGHGVRQWIGHGIGHKVGYRIGHGIGRRIGGTVAIDVGSNRVLCPFRIKDNEIGRGSGKNDCSGSNCPNNHHNNNDNAMNNINNKLSHNSYCMRATASHRSKNPKKETQASQQEFQSKKVNNVECNRRISGSVGTGSSFCRNIRPYLTEDQHNMAAAKNSNEFTKEEPNDTGSQEARTPAATAYKSQWDDNMVERSSQLESMTPTTVNCLTGDRPPRRHFQSKILTGSKLRSRSISVLFSTRARQRALTAMVEENHDRSATSGASTETLALRGRIEQFLISIQSYCK